MNEILGESISLGPAHDLVHTYLLPFLERVITLTVGPGRRSLFMRVLRSGEGLVPLRVSLVMLLTTLTTTLLDVVGAEPCVPCIAAHREAFTKSFGLDFGKYPPTNPPDTRVW